MSTENQLNIGARIQMLEKYLVERNVDVLSIRFDKDHTGDIFYVYATSPINIPDKFENANIRYRKTARIHS